MRKLIWVLGLLLGMNMTASAEELTPYQYEELLHFGNSLFMRQPALPEPMIAAFANKKKDRPMSMLFTFLDRGIKSNPDKLEATCMKVIAAEALDTPSTYKLTCSNYIDGQLSEAFAIANARALTLTPAP